MSYRKRTVTVRKSRYNVELWGLYGLTEWSQCKIQASNKLLRSRRTLANVSFIHTDKNDFLCSLVLGCVMYIPVMPSS
jgi:hypothetical protein